MGQYLEGGEMALRIEDGKTASDALTGCAPIDWVKSVMGDFALAWKQTVIDAKQLWTDFWYGVRGVGETINETISSGWSWLWNKINQVPAVEAINNGVSYGIGLVRKAWDGLDRCTKAVIKRTAVVTGAVVAIAGGIWALCAIVGAVGANAIAFAAITITAGLLLRAFAGAVRFIYNFNWNQPDASIEAEYKQKLVSIAGYAGEAIGYAIGGATCGWLAGTAIGRFNPVLAAKIKTAMPEIFEEIKQEFDAFIGAASRIGMGIIFADVYKNVRRWIKKQAFRFPIFGSRIDKAIQAWGSPSSKAWSFAIAVENAIENIQNPITRAFVENGVEGLFDSCDEAIFTIAAAVG